MALKENIMRPNPGINQFNEEPKQIDYEDDRIGRLLEITNNLEKFYNENPDLFANEEEFKKNFHFDERSPMQQALVQGFRNKKQMEPTKSKDSNEDIFGEVAGEIETSPDKGTERDVLVGGGSVAEAPKTTDTTKESETVKEDKAQSELEDTPSKENKVERKKINMEDYFKNKGL